MLQDPGIDINTWINSIEKKIKLFKYILFPEVSNIDIINIIRYIYFLLLLIPLIFLLEIYKIILYIILGKALGLDSLLNQVL